MKKIYLLLSALFIHFSLLAEDSTKTKAPESFLKDRVREAIGKNGRAKLDLYVMSFCPYGVNAEKFIVPILKELEDSIDFNLYFIATEMTAGIFQSMHGEMELLEDRRQLVIARHFRKKLPAYLLHRSSNYIAGEWEESALAAGIAIEKVNELMERKDEMDAFAKNIRLAIGKKIYASPTLFINDSVYKGRFSTTLENTSIYTCEGGPGDGLPCNEESDCPKYCFGGPKDDQACQVSLDCEGICDGGPAQGRPCKGTLAGECLQGGRCALYTCGSRCAGPYCCDFKGKCHKVSREICEATVGPNRFFDEISCSQCLLLPNALRVESLNANYKEENGTVEVNWQLESDMSREFYVQRSRDGQDFKDIAYIDDGSFINNSFHYTDIQPYDVGHYRLVFPTRDGQAFSQVITAVGVKSGKLFLLPNPAKESVRVLINNMQQFNTQLSVTDMSGRIVIQKMLTQGQCDVDISKLSAGIFIVRATINGKVYTSRMMKK